MTPEEKLSQCQIQITPVDDGFVIQASAIDGRRKNAKQIADTVPNLRKKVYAIVDQLYEPVTIPTATVEESPPVGPTGTQSSS